MMTFIGNYEVSGSYGYYDNRYCVVIAETKEVALGLVLEEYPDTMARDWEILEVGYGIHHITSASS